MKPFLFSSTVLFAFVSSLHAQKTLPQLGKDPIDKVIDAMTDQEKASIIMGTGIKGIGGNMETVGDVEGRVPGAAGNTFQVTRLGIPAIILADGPAGLRISATRKEDKATYFATAFPVATALASTWNLELVENVGKAMGSEVKAYGCDVLLAPALNIMRNPLCGRNFEYYSEDPIVAGKTAAAMVNGIESENVGTSVKHFAANNQETNRMGVNEHITERTMRELYLRGFEITIKESQPWTVMSSYNLINGKYTSARKDLLTQILREEWGFKGLVMSDWFGGYDTFKKIQDSTYSSDVSTQLSAGNDLLMPGLKSQQNAVLKSLKDGKLSRKQLDENVKRVLELIIESPHFKQIPYNNKPDLALHGKITRKAASEGMVLLKNKNQTLPYSQKSGEIAVFGVTSYNFIAGGTGSGNVNEAYTVSLIDGLQNAGYKIDKELADNYVPYMSNLKKIDDERRKKEGILALPKKFPEIEISSEKIDQKAASSAVAIITIGRDSGESGDRKIVDDFNLATDELNLIKEVTDAFHKRNKKVIVILNIGGVIETTSWKEIPDAILIAWQPGQEGGNSVIDVISGKENPSGKLTMTWPEKYLDTPSAKNFPNYPLSKVTVSELDDRHAQEVSYEEGIYVGYRYFETFGVKPSYEFGYGLSYGTFEYSDVKLSSDVFTDKIEVSINIKNTGKFSGKEVAQLYLSAPSKTIDKPVIELKGFAKTKVLQPGESQTLTMILNPKDLASFLEKRSAWIAESGKYTIQIGSSSRNFKQSATFNLPAEKVVEKVTNAFALDVPITEIKPKN